jgi:hypothetical protein
MTDSSNKRGTPDATARHRAGEVTQVFLKIARLPLLLRLAQISHQL